MMDAAKYETLHETIRTAARMVLDSPLADTFSTYTRESVERVAKSTEGGYLNVDFRSRGEGTAETECTLYVKYDGCSWDTETREDGSLWRSYATEVTLNWPCHGSCSPELARKRMAFYDEVIALAESIKAAIAMKVEICVRTAEEQAQYLAEQAAREAARKLDRTLKAAADVVRKGMRVGQDRPVPMALIPGVATGNYEFVCEDYGGKVERKFRMTVDTKWNTSYVTRLS